MAGALFPMSGIVRVFVVTQSLTGRVFLVILGVQILMEEFMLIAVGGLRAPKQ